MKKIALSILAAAVFTTLVYRPGWCPVGVFPQGSNGDVQYQDRGGLGSSSDLHYSTPSKTLSVSTVSAEQVTGSTITVRKKIVFPDGTSMNTAASGNGSGGGGYAIEPATVTAQLNKGFSSTTGTVTGNFSCSSCSFADGTTSGTFHVGVGISFGDGKTQTGAAPTLDQVATSTAGHATVNQVITSTADKATVGQVQISTADKATISQVIISTSDKATTTQVQTSTSDKITVSSVATTYESQLDARTLVQLSTSDKATVGQVQTSTSDKATVSFVNTSSSNKAIALDVAAATAAALTALNSTAAQETSHYNNLNTAISTTGARLASFETAVNASTAGAITASSVTATYESQLDAKTLVNASSGNKAIALDVAAATAAAATIAQLNSTNTALIAFIESITSSTLSGGGGGIKSLYFRNTLDLSMATTYNMMLSTPSTNAENTRAASVASANGLVMVASFTTIVEGLGRDVNVIPAGFFQFAMLAKIDSFVGNTNIVIDVATMSRTGSGSAKILASTVTNINSTDYQPFISESVLASDVTISTDDRLQVNVYALTTSGLARTITIITDGSSRDSRIGTTILRNPTFISLNDAPSSYSGQTGKFPQVNATETALGFVTVTQAADRQNLPKSGSTDYIQRVTSGSTVDALNVMGDLSFGTTMYDPLLWGGPVGVSTMIVTVATSPFWGLANFDAITSTATNFQVYAWTAPPDFVAGSTIAIQIEEVSTGVVTGQTSYVVSAASGTAGVAVSTVSTDYSAPQVINITGVTAARGGHRLSASFTAMNGTTAIVNPSGTVYFLVVRDGANATNDPSTPQSYVRKLWIRYKVRK